MTEIGYALSCEEHGPLDLVRYAQMAEQAGFTFAMISDYFNPWVSQQGNASFVWNVIGGISQVTSKLRLGTGVTCPTFRYHPVIVAQAAATSAAMLPGRFILGLGSGENLNEHITGEHWPPIEIRHEMLEEAVDIIRLLFQGKETSYWGNYFTVEDACLFTLPEQLPPIFIAASGEKAAELAGRLGDGLVSTSPKKEVMDTYNRSGGNGKQKIGQVTVCWAKNESQARQTALKWWPNAATPSTLSEFLPTPAYFEDSLKSVTEDQVAESVTCGPDKKKHLDEIQTYVDAGYDQVYVHQVGPDQEGFFQFYQREILPEFK